MTRAEAKVVGMAAAMKCEEMTATEVKMEGFPNFRIISVPIRARVTRLRSNFTCDLNQALVHYHGRQ